MKKFEFRLQKLFEIRDRKEKEIKNKLGYLIKVQKQEEEEKKILINDLKRKDYNYRKNFLFSDFNISEALSHENFSRVNCKKIQNLEIKKKDMDLKIKRIKKNLLEASIQKKVVEKIKDKKIKEYSQDLKKREDFLYGGTGL